MAAGTAFPDVHPNRHRRKFDESPLLVFYGLTQDCDLACLHCRACAQTGAHQSELTTTESLTLIDQLTAFPDPPTLVLTGGDPFKRDDLFSLIEHAAVQGLEVSITPSTTPLLTPQALRQLKRAGNSRMAVSLDGADAETHDRMRGVPGSYQRTLEILIEAAICEIPTQVNTTLTSANASQIDAMSELLASLGFCLWSVFFLAPVGRAVSQQRLSAHEHEGAFEKLWRQRHCRPFAIKTTEAPHYRRYCLQEPNPGSRTSGDRSPRRWSSGVNAGNGVLFVSHTGLIHPSGFLPIVCGVFPLDHVVRVYQSSKIFRGLRDAGRLEGKCGACEFRHVCGGSRARVYAVTGNLFAEEPDCCYIPQSSAELKECHDAAPRNHHTFN